MGVGMKMDEAWYIKWVDHTGMLRWSGFVEGFDAAWEKFAELRKTAAREEWQRFEQSGEIALGRIRVREPDGATLDEMGSFDNASGFGVEPLIGYAGALAKLKLEGR
jgi:hypothetical protein